MSIAAAIGAGAFALWLAQREGTKARVLNIERAKGVNESLLSFLQFWQDNGEFDILVAPDGGLRYGAEAAAKQLSYYNAGNSRAKTLAETPHGRGGALDLWPVGFNPAITLNRNSPDSLNYKWAFNKIGSAAMNQGLDWGGRWTTLYDLPHIEMTNWRSLAYPPKVP